MILTDAIVERVHRLSVEVLRLTAQGVLKVRPDAAGADVGTGYALFAGEGSPLTQLTEFAHRTPGDPGLIDAFFTPRAENWEVGVTPFTDAESLRALFGAGYRPAQFEGVLAQWVQPIAEAPEVEIVEVDDDLDVWMETTGRGWAQDEGLGSVPSELERAVAAMPGRRYLARIDGQAAATASMYEFGDSVVLGGASTRLPFRGRGLQSALLRRRLSDAGKGRFALIGAEPGTTSHRNAQRAGFAPLYSKLTLMRR